MSIFGTPGATLQINPLGHDSCNGSATPPCAWSSLVGVRMVIGGAPPVSWATASVTPTGLLRFVLTSAAPYGSTATFSYAIRDKYGSSRSTVTVTVGHAPVTPAFGKYVPIGGSLSFDLMALTKCNDLQSPCPASDVYSLVIGKDSAVPLVTASATKAGIVTVRVASQQLPFVVAHIPYALRDKYGTSRGVMVIGLIDNWHPVSKLIFNNPLGSYIQQQFIDVHVLQLIQHAPKGATIQMLTYTFDGQDMTNALVAAYRRGVNVRVLQSWYLQSGNVPYLQSVLGRNPGANSFYYICHGACRSYNSGAPHAKVFSVSQSGQAHDIVVSAASNFSYGGSTFQWFDGYQSTDNAVAYNGFNHVFSEARLDTRPSDWGGLFYVASSEVTDIYTRIVTSISQMAGTPPKPVTVPVLAGSANDWLERALSQVGCNASPGYGIAYGSGRRTLVRVAVRALQGARGYDIAHMLRQLAEAGCDVRVITTQPSTDVVRELQRSSARVPGGIWVGDQTWRWKYQVCGQDAYGYDIYCWQPGLYTHMHALAVSGNYGGVQKAMVWTGSESWAEGSYFNDEQVVQLTGTNFFSQFYTVFNYNWAHYTHPFGQRPTGYPPAAPVTYP